MSCCFYAASGAASIGVAHVADARRGLSTSTPMAAWAPTHATPPRTMPKRSRRAWRPPRRRRAPSVGCVVAHTYDLDDKRTFLLKFTRSGGRTESGEGEKTVVQVLFREQTASV